MKIGFFGFRYQIIIIAIVLLLGFVIGLFVFVTERPIDFSVLYSVFAFLSGGILFLTIDYRLYANSKRVFIKPQKILNMLIVILIAVDCFLLYEFFSIDMLMNLPHGENRNGIGLLFLSSICWTIIFLIEKKNLSRRS